MKAFLLSPVMLCLAWKKHERLLQAAGAGQAPAMGWQQQRRAATWQAMKAEISSFVGDLPAATIAQSYRTAPCLPCRANPAPGMERAASAGHSCELEETRVACINDMGDDALSRVLCLAGKLSWCGGGCGGRRRQAGPTGQPEATTFYTTIYSQHCPAALLLPRPAIALTCRRWHTLLLSEPQLWSTIRIETAQLDFFSRWGGFLILWPACTGTSMLQNQGAWPSTVCEQAEQQGSVHAAAPTTYRSSCVLPACSRIHSAGPARSLVSA